MQNITKYSGENGAVQVSFIREIQVVYNRMLRTPAEHTIDGFGEWEFINLLQGTLKGEAKDVLAGILYRWDFKNSDNDNWEAVNDAKRRRHIWREYRCDRTAYKSLRAMSGQTREPPKPYEDEPQDLERLIDELRTRFRSSTTENMSGINNFRPTTNETPERMFARFSILARPLEDERPRVMTADQLKTSYLFYLREIRSEAQDLELSRDIRDAERDHKLRGLPPLTRHEIHDLVLLQDRELVIEETKLRDVGLNRVSVKERLGPRVNDRLGGTAGHDNSLLTTPRGKIIAKRSCNRCHIRGHLAHACIDRTPPPKANPPTKGDMGETKPPATDNADREGKPTSKARTAATDRPQYHRNRGAGRGGGRTNGSAIGGRSNYTPRAKMGSHTTQGALCTHCGDENHTAEQCWKLHPELNPFAAKHENANMVNLVNENHDINRRWEAEQQAREKRSLWYEKERDDREKMKEEKAEKENEENNETTDHFQYMVDTHIKSVEPSPERNEAAEEAERELRYMDQQELLILYPDEIANVNIVHVPPSPADTVASWFTPSRQDAEPALTRSGTQPRRSPRLDASTSRTLHFDVPRSILKKSGLRKDASIHLHLLLLHLLLSSFLRHRMNQPWHKK